MDIVTLCGLVKIELPSATLRLSDGGIVTWGAETFESKDVTFGSIEAVDALTEGVGDEVPALRISFLPVSTAAAADLTDAGWQTSRVRFWIAEVNRSTGAVSGTPELMFEGQLDTADLTVDTGSRVLTFDLVSTAERLFELNPGNTLSSRFHKYLFPTETGEDVANGLSRTVPWGIEAPAGGARGVSGASGFASTIINNAVRER